MHTVKYENGSDRVGYDTLEELLALSNIEISEFGGYYYVSVIEDAPYFTTMYKVDKASGKAVYYPDYIGYMLDIEDKATPVDPNKLKELLK